MSRIQGNTAFKQGKYHEAITLYSEALAHDRSPATLSNRAACYLHLNQWDKAQKDASDALKLAPEPPLKLKLHYRLARALLRQGLDPAQQVNLGLAIDPNNAELNAMLGAVPIQTFETLPPRFSSKITSDPRASTPSTAVSQPSFISPKLPLTYASIVNLTRDSSSAAYDWWYTVDPQQLVIAHKSVGIEPSTLKYLRTMVAERGGPQGEKLLAAAKQCNGYAMAAMMCP